MKARERYQALTAEERKAAVARRDPAKVGVAFYSETDHDHRSTVDHYALVWVDVDLDGPA